VEPTLDQLRRAPLHRPYSSHAAWIVLGIGLLAVAWLLFEPVEGDVPEWERAVFESINGLPDWLRWPIWPFMQLGNFWILAVAGGIALLVWRRPAPAVSIVLAVLLAWLVAKFVKSVAERDRPAFYIRGTELRESGIEGLGFVSGHAAIAFAVATVLAPWLPRRLRPVPFVLAVLVAFARVYYGAHLPLDVVGGAGLGIVCGILANLVVGVPNVDALDTEADAGAEALAE